MANNYRQWSEAIELSKDKKVFEEQQEWIGKVLGAFNDWDLPEAENITAEPQELFKQHLASLGVEVEAGDDLEFWPDFEWRISKDNVDGPLGDIWVHADEGGNLEHLAAFVQGFIKKFEPTWVFKLQWADFCSKPRIGEFGGGALVVTADKIVFKGTDQVVEDVCKELGVS